MTQERHTNAALLRRGTATVACLFAPHGAPITMNRTALFMLCAGVVAATAPDRMLAHGKGDWSFQRVGTFANYKNAAVGDETVSEIIAATEDGRTLIYTDALRGRSASSTSGTRPGRWPTAPSPSTPIRPTTPTIRRPRSTSWAIATRWSRSTPARRRPARAVSCWSSTSPAARSSTTIDLGGQPDSAKISPDHRYPGHRHRERARRGLGRWTSTARVERGAARRRRRQAYRRR